MLVFTLAISCLTACNLPCYMDLTFQISVQYCSLHQTFLSAPDTSTTGHCFHFGLATSFFLELFVIALCSSPVAYCSPSDLVEGGHSSSSVVSFCPFILLMEFSLQERWGGLPFPPPVGRVLLELFMMTHPSWVALHRMAHSFIVLCKPLCHGKAVILERGNCLWLQIINIQLIHCFFFHMYCYHQGSGVSIIHLG